ncbi:cell division protein FtsA [Candidatus Uhrbacteria bacterium]|nr:cell division protein FtsA [Candidatus Uhrbacteria bacterium]MBD3284314.1 cell division protein FtsA [Candidatus Uhrbacteria bacterium]
MKQPLIVGLDLGSSQIRLAMGQVSQTPERGPVLNVVGAVAVPSQGISKGVVTALEDAVAAVSSGLEQGEQQLGMPIDEAVVGIGGTHFNVIDAKGVVGVSRADGDIRPEDVERVMESARSAANPANHEILHVLPHGFTVDGQSGITDPVGMHGIRLEANAHLVLGIAGNVRNMTKCVFRTGLDIASLVFGPMACAQAVTNARERELGVCVVNIGAATTSVILFEEGDLIHAKVIPIGSEHITSDIAIGLRISLEVAEQIKLLHGSALPEHYGKQDEVDMATFGAEVSEIVSLQYLSEIIQARTEEIFEKVEEELRAADRSGLLPAGAVLTGGGAKLPGIVEVAKASLRLPSSLGAATHLQTPMPEKVHDPSFATAVGLVQWGFDEIRQEGGSGPSARVFARGGDLVKKVGGSIKKVFKSFIP